MSVFDLKPLSTKTIEDLRIKSHHLWEIKIDENIYGPFETLQLKHYAKENKSILSRALVSSMSVDNWKPFFDVREFSHGTNYNGPYWMLAHGQKSSPLSKEEIAKRIELGTITRHDEISEDEGRQWHRISTHPEFEVHFTTGTSLPQTPQDSSFQKAKLKVLEQLERKKEFPDEKENMASLTHISLATTKERTRTVQIEDIKMAPAPSERGSFWENYRVHAMWVTPLLLIAAYFVLNGDKPSSQVAESGEASLSAEKETGRRSKKDRWNRTPANADENGDYDRSSVTQTPNMDDNYPTVIETHQDDQNYPDPDKEADQVAEINDQEDKGEEHSLVQQPNRDPAQDGESLDATMNNEAQEPNPAVDQPVVEEVSDF